MFTYSNQHLSAYQPGVRALDQSSSQQWDAEESPVRFLCSVPQTIFPEQMRSRHLSKTSGTCEWQSWGAVLTSLWRVTPHMQRCVWQIRIVLRFCMLLSSATLKLRWQLHCSVIVPCSVWSSSQLIFLVIFKLKCGIECKMGKGCLKTKT